MCVFALDISFLNIFDFSFAEMTHVSGVDDFEWRVSELLWDQREGVIYGCVFLGGIPIFVEFPGGLYSSGEDD